MESKYLFEVTRDRMGMRSISGAMEAADRLQKKIRTGSTLVAIHVKNPRYKGE